MRGSEIVAWSQCRQANGELKNMLGFLDGQLTSEIEGAQNLAVGWVQDVKGIVKDTVEEMTDLFIKGEGSGDFVEYIPAPAISGNTTINQQWQRILFIHGFANVEGISISAAPDHITPPVPPMNDPAIMGSVVVTDAVFMPTSSLYQISDIGAPRFDFTHTRWFGLHDKPITPMASPWQLDTDTFVNPRQLEPDIWNVNIPIAKYRVPPDGLAVWAYWNSQTPPRLNVRLITAPPT